MAAGEIDSKFMQVIKKDDLSQEELEILARFKIAVLRDPFALNMVGKRAHEYD